MPALVVLYAIWDLLVISADASADPYIFRVLISAEIASYLAPVGVT